MRFIVRHSESNIVYAGDKFNKQLVVITDDYEPYYIKLDKMLQRGILMLDQTLLIIGCEQGYLDKFSLMTPGSP